MAKKKRSTPRGPRSGVLDRRGIAWFKPESHARIIEVMVHPHDISRDYKTWREKAESQEGFWKSKNRLAVRVVIDPEKFLAWCAAVPIQPNGEALNRYVFEGSVGEQYVQALRNAR